MNGQKLVLDRLHIKVWSEIKAEHKVVLFKTKV